MMCHVLQEEDGKASKMLKWVRRCACPKGGFGALPRSNPDLLHTAYALLAMRIHDQLTPEAVHLHGEWLRGQVINYIQSPDMFHDIIWLEDVYYLLLGLKAVSGIREMAPADRDTLVAEAMKRWNAEGHSPEATHYLARILSALEALSGNLKREIGEQWLPEHTRDLGTVNLGDQLETVWHLVRVASLFHSEAGSELTGVQQLRHNLSILFQPRTTLFSLVRQFLRPSRQEREPFSKIESEGKDLW